MHPCRFQGALKLTSICLTSSVSGSSLRIAKVAVVIIKKEKATDDDEIFMSVVDWCGHDSRGNPTIRVHEDGREELLDDVPKVPEAFRKLMPAFPK